MSRNKKDRQLQEGIQHLFNLFSGADLEKAIEALEKEQVDLTEIEAQTTGQAFLFFLNQLLAEHEQGVNFLADKEFKTKDGKTVTFDLEKFRNLQAIKHIQERVDKGRNYDLSKSTEFVSKSEQIPPGRDDTIIRSLSIDSGP